MKQMIRVQEINANEMLKVFRTFGAHQILDVFVTKRDNGFRIVHDMNLLYVSEMVDRLEDSQPQSTLIFCTGQGNVLPEGLVVGENLTYLGSGVDEDSFVYAFFTVSDSFILPLELFRQTRVSDDRPTKKDRSRNFYGHAGHTVPVTSFEDGHVVRYGDRTCVTQLLDDAVEIAHLIYLCGLGELHDDEVHARMDAFD